MILLNLHHYITTLLALIIIIDKANTMSRGEFCEFCEILDGRHRKTSQTIA
jgi:hypothetical protein